MATLDDMLENESGGTPAAKGTLEWAEQNSGVNASSSTASTPAAPKADTSTAASEKNIVGSIQGDGKKTDTSYDELYQILNSTYKKPETAEERAKREKKEKRAQIFNAIGDGIAALSNLYFTTQGAPNMYNGKKTMTGTAQARYDKLDKERRENNIGYANMMLKLKQLEADRAYKDREWRRSLGVDDRAKEEHEWKRAAEERDKAAHDADMEGKRYDNDEKEIRNRYAETYYGNRANRVGQRSSLSGGSGKPGEYLWYDADGNKHYAHSYEAARMNSIDAGTWEEDTQTSTTTETSASGRPQGTRTTEKTARGYSKNPKVQGEGGSNNKKGNPMGGDSSKKKNPMS